MNSRNLALLALGVVSSVASAACLLALDHAGIISLVPPAEEVREQTQRTVAAPGPAEATPELTDRFAYVPLDASDALSSPPADDPLPDETDAAEVLAALPADELPAGEAEEPEVTGPWLAEVQPESMEAEDEPQLTDGPRPAQPRRAAVPRAPSWSIALKKRLAEISPGASARLAAKFRAAEAAWPPADIVLVAIKDEKVLELFARPENGGWQFIHRYPVLAASGTSGPKLRQGDKQVPEGIYRISLLNPHSRYHVSLRVNYPNAFDRRMAEADGRSNLGGDIMIHGKALSAGCLAIGDPAAEEIFVLAAQVGLENIKLIIAPTDFRRRSSPTIEASQPKWVPGLYSEIATAMAEYKSPPSSRSLLSFFWN